MGDYSGYDFGRSRKEKYVGKGTGSIITTPNQRKGYTKSGSPRMKISERNTPKRLNVEVGSGPTYMGRVHPANELSGGWYNGRRGSTEYERKGKTELSLVGRGRPDRY